MLPCFLLATITLLTVTGKRLEVTVIPLKLPENVTELVVRSAATVTLTATTFTDPSYKTLVTLDLCNNSISALPDTTFSSLPNLRRLALADNALCYDQFTNQTFAALSTSLTELNLHSMSCRGGDQTTYGGGALKTLTGLRTLTINGLPRDFDADYAALVALESLHLVGSRCDARHLRNTTFSAFSAAANLRTLTIRRCNITDISLKALLPFSHRLTTLNVACNPGLTWTEVSATLMEAGLLASLRTLVADDINPGTDQYSFHPTSFAQSSVNSSLARISFRANAVITFLPVGLELLRHLTSFNVGYNRFIFDAGMLRDIVAGSRDLPLKVVDASNLYESRSTYRQLYCRPDGPYEADAYFRSPAAALALPGVNGTRSSPGDTHASAANVDAPSSPIPSSVQTLYLDGYHRKGAAAGHWTVLGGNKLEAVNQLVVLNLSSTFIQTISGPFVNFYRLQVRQL